MGRAAIILLALGAGMLVIGTLFKIQHWPLAGVMLIASYILLPLGGTFFIGAVIKNKGLTGALDPSRRDEEPR